MSKDWKTKYLKKKTFWRMTTNGLKQNNQNRLGLHMAEGDGP